MKKAIFLIDGVRTPFLKVKGTPGPFSAADLGVSSAKALLMKQPFAATELDRVITGCVGPSEAEANIARVIALRIGCGHAVPAWTVQRNCASGLQAIDSAAQSIASGQCHLVLAIGCEAMSRAPLLWRRSWVTKVAGLREAKGISAKIKALCLLRPADFIPVVALMKGLTDPIINLTMGQTAEELAYRFQITREEMDQYALQSHQRAELAIASGENEGEITPLYAYDGKIYEKDEGVRQAIQIEKLGKLKAVFDKHGNITAGNSSQISDGAASVILASQEAVERYGLPVLAKIVDSEWAALDPILMGLGPVHAMMPLLRRHHLTLSEIDHLEINEAFAAQIIACKKAWDPSLGEISLEKLNPQGGAIAIGHPVGASGVRLVLHAARMLKKYNHRRALTSLCIGGGQGGAMLLERGES